MPEKKKIINRLKSLEDIDGVSVEVSESGQTVKVKHQTYHSLDFIFRWLDNTHFAGYFLDGEGHQSQAVISLWTGLDAIHFAAAYSLLVELRARQ
ncbi:MAG: hypothetical protein Q6368_004575 [Candidatus Baldrarchaeota archaeon]